MKFAWLSITAALLASTVSFAEENQSPQIGDRDVSLDEIHEMYSDRDQDQLSTINDQCQNTILTSKVNSIGCDLDSDQDGIYDKNDQCPSTPFDTAVNFLGCEADTDYDGVVDSKDQCPLTILGSNVDAEGCKAIGDADFDGIADNIDQCLDTPANVEVNQFGCQPRTSMLVNILFDTGSYAIRSDQEPYLTADLSTLKDLQTDEVVLIVGHTDNIGRSADNIRLSWNRASSVKQFLINHSDVDRSRIYLIGKGESSPIADNSTGSGRQKNRRIELKAITEKALPQSALLQTPQ